MDTNDFDIDFDFEKEYGRSDDFDAAEAEQDLDLSQFDTKDGEDAFRDFALDADEDDAFAQFLTADSGETAGEDSGSFDEDLFFPRKQDYQGSYGAQDAGSPEDRYDPDAGYTEEEYDPNAQHAEGEYDPNAQYAEGEYDPNAQSAEGEYDPNAQYAEGYDPNAPYDGEPQYDEYGNLISPKPPREKKKFSLPKLPKREQKERKKSDKPTLFSKFLDWYMEPINRRKNPEPETVDENGRRKRRRRPTKMQIFKEAYLPPIIGLVALVLIVSFVAGALTNGLKLRKLEKAKKEAEALQASQEADRIATVYQELLKTAQIQATQYDYDGAVATLDSFTTDDPTVQQELTAKKSEYLNAKAKLVEWKDVNAIPNLSFHVLIQDPIRAFADSELGGMYNRNFVTVEEFSKILDQLYGNGYILVDFKHFVASAEDLTGSMNYSYNPILLPEGKKPVMITETMVNYYDYMVDGNKDGEPDAAGAGFANKLIVDAAGEIKAKYVDGSGQTQVGDYDLVPVLETFIKNHPDFSYKGSRATLAVTGNQGIFGYRCNTSYVQQFGQDYYDQEVADAKVLVQALRDKGYTMACYTYSNKDYRASSVAEIRTDLQNWAGQVTPILGEVDTIVFAKAVDIEDYSGAKFNTLYEAGFRFFMTNGNEPKTEVNISNVRHSRLMVTGNSIAWHAAQFNNYFDPNVVLDISNRKEVPN